MSVQEKTELSCGRDVPWYPQRKPWQSGRLFSQDAGLLPFLEPRDPRWMDVEWLQRSLAAAYWSGYIPAPMFVPYISASMPHPEQTVSKEQYKWRVSLDVAHFSPSEISLSVSDGFLQVKGKHEERPDEHGFIARCFTRKYRLPAEIAVSKIASTLSVDGILTVEAPVPESSVPTAFIIPIKVEMEVDGEREEEEKSLAADPDSCRAPADPDSTCTEDYGEKSPPEVRGDQTHPDSSAAGPQQYEKMMGQEEETHEGPSGESHLSDPAQGEGTGSFQDSLKQHEASESQESPDKDTSIQQEHKEPDEDREIQVAGIGGAADETAQSEEPELDRGPLGQKLEAHDVQQEHTE